MMYRAVAFVVLLAACGDPSVDVAPVEAPAPIRLEIVEESLDPGSSFTDCHLDFDISGNLHAAYRFLPSGQTGTELRYAVNSSGEWRAESIGQFSSMQRSFDLAVETRQPSVLFAAEQESQQSIVNATREVDGTWSADTLLSEVGELSGLRLASNSVAGEIRGLLPPVGTEYFRDASIEFGDWQIEPIGFVPFGAIVRGFDITIDRRGTAHACITSDNEGEQILYYARLTDGLWDIEEAYVGSLSVDCRIGTDREGVPRLGVVEQTAGEDQLLLLEQAPGGWQRVLVTLASSFAAFDMVTSSGGNTSFSWIDSSVRELILGSETMAFEPERVADVTSGSSASLALSPNGNLGFCTEIPGATGPQVIAGTVQR
ncbi:MAG: hypothetical protein AAFU77_15150 [Myxococcota bacterium]